MRLGHCQQHHRRPGQAVDDDDEFVIHIADAGRLPAGHDFAENAGASRAQTFTSTDSVRIAVADNADLGLPQRLCRGIYRKGRELSTAAAIVRPSFNKFRMSGQSRRRFCLLPSFPTPLPSFPRKRESRNARPATVLSDALPSWIPAYAGMTVGAAIALLQLVQDERMGAVDCPLILNLLKDERTIISLTAPPPTPPPTIPLDREYVGRCG